MTVTIEELMSQVPYLRTLIRRHVNGETLNDGEMSHLPTAYRIVAALEEREAAERACAQRTGGCLVLVELIRQAEWSGYSAGSSECPWCESSRSEGHLPTCPVALILYPKEGS